MRNRLAQACFDINLSVPSVAVQDEIPRLVAALEGIAPEDNGL